MLWRGCAAGVAAALALLAWVGPSRADGVIRLGLKVDASQPASGFGGGVMTLELKPGQDAETVDAHWGRRRAYYRGYYGGYAYRPYSYGYRYGYSSYYYPRYSFYTPQYYYPRYSFYPGIYGYRSYYYAPSYYSAPYCFPQSGVVGVTAPTVTLEIGTGPAAPPRQRPAPEPVQAAPDTFPYDGGPANPVPMPKARPAPQADPEPASVPLDGRLVSIPGRTAKHTYPAYGEQGGRNSSGKDRLVPVDTGKVARSRR